MDLSLTPTPARRLVKGPLFPLVAIFFFFVLFLLCWETLARFGMIARSDWSSPSAILLALGRDFMGAEIEFADQNRARTLLAHIFLTLKRWISGFGLAVVAGVLAGFALGVSRTAYSLGLPVVNFFRALPSAAIWPFCGVILGYGVNSQLVVIVFGSLWPILINTMDGVRLLPDEARDSLLFMKLEPWRRWIVTLQWSAGSIFTGIEIGAAVAFLLTVTVEIFWPAEGGLGWYLNYHAQYREQAELLGGLFVAALLGYLLNTGVHLLREQLLFWESPLSRNRSASLPAAITNWLSARRALHAVADTRLRRILASNTVTETLEEEFGPDWELKVLFNFGEPYVLPKELRHFIARVKDLDIKADVRQRDVLLRSKPNANGRPIIFARSWFVPALLPDGVVRDLQAEEVTIGLSLRGLDEAGISYRNLRFKRFVSRKLGSVLGSGGSIEVVERTRLIFIARQPAILIKEYVPAAEIEA